MKTTVTYLPHEDNEDEFDFECDNCGTDDIQETSTHCPSCGSKIDWHNSK